MSSKEMAFRLGCWMIVAGGLLVVLAIMTDMVVGIFGSRISNSYIIWPVGAGMALMPGGILAWALSAQLSDQPKPNHRPQGFNNGL